MTRRHFVSLAWELRQAHPEPTTNVPLESDAYWGMVEQWERDVRAVCAVARSFNGNFDTERFMVAAGLIRRPDGSMFPMAAPR